MSVTGKQVTEQALKLIGHVNSQGAVDWNRESKYAKIASAYLTQLQLEILQHENSDAVPATVESLDDDLLVLDANALRVMPSGLAMYFALVDHDSDNYNHYSTEYHSNLIPQIQSASDDVIEDHYGVTTDQSFQ